MSLHDEMKAALDEWCGERAEVSADAEETFRAILARHPEPAVSKPTAEQVLTIAEGLRKRFAVSNGTQVWVEFQGSAEALADEIADIFTQLQVQAPVGEGLENGAGDGEREALDDLIQKHWVATPGEFRNVPLAWMVAAGYRKPTLPSVEEVAKVLAHTDGGHHEARFDAGHESTVDLYMRHATAVLDLLKRGA